jgi:hypothetical protein
MIFPFQGTGHEERMNEMNQDLPTQIQPGVPLFGVYFRLVAPNHMKL